MKRIFGFVSVVTLSLLLFAGCSSNVEKTMSCTRTVNQGDMQLDLQYNVKYKGKYVTEVESIEKAISNDIETLKLYKDSIEKVYNPYKDIKYYDYSIIIDGNTLISKTSINYEKIDTDAMIKVDSANEQMIKNGKVKIVDIENLYKSVGSICIK